MGAWSAKIFDDDGALDIVDEYKILLGYGISPEDTYEKITEYFYPDYQDGDDEDVYWLAIALYQWKNGILMDELPAAETAEGLSFKPIVSEPFKTPKEVVSAIWLETDGAREDKKWAEITRIGQDKEFPVPEMYTQHHDAPYRDVSQFTITLIQTFALDEDEETEWYSEEKIRKMEEEEEREWEARKQLRENR